MGVHALFSRRDDFFLSSKVLYSFSKVLISDKQKVLYRNKKKMSYIISQKSYIVLYKVTLHSKYTGPLMFENLYQARQWEQNVAGCGVVICGHAVFSAAVAALLAELLVPPHVLPAATQVCSYSFFKCLMLLIFFSTACSPSLVIRCNPGSLLACWCCVSVCLSVCVRVCCVG